MRDRLHLDRQAALKAAVDWVQETLRHLDALSVALQAVAGRLPNSEDQLSDVVDAYLPVSAHLAHALGAAGGLAGLDLSMRQAEGQSKSSPEPRPPNLPAVVPEPPKTFRRVAGDGGEGNKDL